MNPGNRKLLAAVVAQHLELGETEWYFNPLPFLKEGGRGRPPDFASGAREGRVMTGRKKTEEIVCCTPECTNEEALAGKNSLQELNAAVQECLRCQLGEKRKNFVFGAGNPEADIMFVGEAPGADEDLQGLPFVGRAGQLLTKMIESIKLSRGDVYITNVLKCRPPGNRDPLPAEIEKCEPILLRQIELIRPKVICALGRISGQTLLRTDATLGSLRGKVHDYHGVKLIVTYHPAALLRNPQWKRPTWEDLKFLRREYDGVEL
ncbi:MAG: uracil-DNA glycosylase [Candidatus Latescibacterota bacterium]